MTEYRLPGWGTVDTFTFHEHRERAPHLEQPEHHHRLLAAHDLVRHAVAELYDHLDRFMLDEKVTVTDLGCGDGGLLSLLKDDDIECWGYDFQPSNQAGWYERGVTAYLADWTEHILGVGEVVVLTEVLEHLRDPHGELQWLHSEIVPEWIVASSPAYESDVAAADCHAWAWDFPGYEKLFQDAGWEIITHQLSYWSQLVLAKRV